MKYKNREIYDMGRILLKESIVGFDEFLEKTYFSAILENEFLMRRPLEEISAWVLFDFKDFEKSSITILKSLTKSQNLNEDESQDFIEILKDSYVSLFEIKKEGYDYKFHDLILDIDYEIEYTSALANVSNKWGLFRIFGPNDKKMVLQTIRSMEETEYFTLHSNLLKLFDEIKSTEKIKIIDKGFLKSNILNILSIAELTNRSFYSDLYESAIEFSDEDLDDAFYDEDIYLLNDLREFKKVFPNYDEDFILSFFYYTFLKIYEECLEGQGKSFKDYDLDYFKIFVHLCSGGNFDEQSQLIESIDLVMTFYRKLAKIGRDVKIPIESLQNVKKYIFHFIKMLDDSIFGFYYDDMLPSIIISNNPSYSANKFLENYDNFLTFLDINSVNLLKSGDLSPAMLRKFTEEAELVPTKNVKTYKNKHFPQVELFLFFTIAKKLTYLYNPGEVQEIFLTDEADEYLSFDELKKFSIWIDSLSKEDFLKSALGENYETYKNLVLDLFNKLLAGEKVEFDDYFDEFKPAIQILIDLDLLDNKSNLKITKLGKALYNYYRTDKKKDNIIEVDFS